MSRLLLLAAEASLPFNECTGGTITEYIKDGKKYRLHKFTSTSSLVVVRSVAPFDLLIVGGGGGGGGSNNLYSGGGGDGGFGAVYTGITGITSGTQTITVGNAGSGKDFQGDAGGTSSALGKTAAGGGGGTTGHDGFNGVNGTTRGPSTNFEDGTTTVQYGIGGGQAGYTGTQGGNGGIGAAPPTAPGGTGKAGLVIVRYQIG